MVIRVRRQASGEIDAAAVEDPSAGRQSDEYRRVAVVGDADSCSLQVIDSQAGIFDWNLRARAASVACHLVSKLVPMRMKSIQAGGKTVKSIE